MEKISPKVINLSNIFLTKHEIEILKLGLSFTPTPKHNISELETDIYHFIRKLRLTYHFRDSTYEDKSIVKSESTFTPKNNENQELETICKNLSETKINIKRISDNIPNLRDGLNSLMTKIRSNEIIIKPADKGSIVVVMSSEYYWTMCQSHLNNEQYYRCLFENDPSLIVNEKIINYANKYRSILTDNEYEYLTNRNYKISNCYMNPKLHKSKELNGIIEIKILYTSILLKIYKL